MTVSSCLPFNQQPTQPSATVSPIEELEDSGTGSSTVSLTDTDLNIIDNDSEACAAETSGPSSLKIKAAHFLLTFKERYGLTQSAVDFAVGSVNQMIEGVSEEHQKSVEKYLQENDIALPTTLDECFPSMDLFSDLQTEYQQTKFYREQFGLVVSINLISLF